MWYNDVCVCYDHFIVFTVLKCRWRKEERIKVAPVEALSIFIASSEWAAPLKTSDLLNLYPANISFFFYFLGSIIIILTLLV